MKKTLLSLIISFLFLTPLSVFALGLITSPIEVLDVRKEQIIKERLSLNNSKSAEIIFELSTSGDIDGWVFFYNLDNEEEIIEKIAVPAEGWKKIGVLITIPNDTPNGEYSGSLIATYKPELVSTENESVATVAQKFSRPVLISVTDKEIISFSTRTFPENYAVKKDEALKIKIFYNNKGNITIKPQAQIKILDLGNKKKELLNAIYPYPETEEAVKPLETKEIIIPYATNGLKKGEYQAIVTVSLNNEQQFEDDFVFVINNTGKVLGISNWKINWPIIVGAIVLILVILSVVFFKKNKRVNIL